ncbi:DUF6807 domain-containing protein [Parachryseolinea silvisoli]|uniref:DUF6807 domain-containing protein n=1 Tax=Parachryseolinea silvisoli TaxID=2873601 RepID=UPI002265AA1F|nr:PmoA family protein [Parachryseolinea silvisoli]
MIKGCLIGAMLLCIIAHTSAQTTGFSLVRLDAKKKVEVWYDGKFLTAYCYFDSTEKPVLYPIKTVSGTTITRGFPIAPRAGERTDHPHHVGLWLNYESVNGLDFWNNSYAIAADKKPKYGSIRHQRVLSANALVHKGKPEAKLETLSHWVDINGNVLLEEITTYTFQVENNSLIIDRACTLKARAEQVVFKDVKDGLLGLRVARSLEMPSNQEDSFVDAQGNVTTVKKMDAEGVTGMYVNKEGIRGDATWAKRSVWTVLNGKTGGKEVSIAIIDHPRNIGYPTYWHARGYGLFAANPLGQKIFSEGKEELNLTLKKDETVNLKYRVVVHEGSTFAPTEIDALANDFAKR